MPLHDSFSTSQSVRLTKMNSVPTTEDLRYALGEATKRIGKVVELPFEHPGNHQLFIVKLALGQGAKVGATWTLQQGDGAEAKKMWTRNSDDVLMVQNKIKIDSQYAGGSDQGATLPPGAVAKAQTEPIILGGSVSSRPSSQEMMAPAPATLDAFFSQNYPPALDAFLASSQPAASDPWASSVQAPSFVSDNSATGEMPMPKAVESSPNAKTAELPRPTLPPKPTEPLTVPLPPPIKIDMAIVNQVHTMLADSNTGLCSYPTFAFFLFKEFARFQKDNSRLAVLVFEVALRIGKDMVPLPPPALATVVQRIRSVCSPLDIVTHLSRGEFAALLAATDGSGAMDFAVSLHEALTDGPLPPGNENQSVMVVIGAASIPETCNHPEVLIAAARQAKEMAKASPNPVLLFPVKQ